MVRDFSVAALEEAGYTVLAAGDGVDHPPVVETGRGQGRHA